MNKTKSNKISKNSLPVIIINNEMVMPFQVANLLITANWNINTINLAIEKYNGNILFILLKNSVTKNDSNKLPNIKNIYEIGTLCKIHNTNNVRVPNNINDKIEFSGLSRVKITKLIHFDNVNYAEFIELDDVFGNIINEKEIFRKIINLVKSKFQKVINIRSEFNNPDLNLTHHSISTYLYVVMYAICNNPKEFQSILKEDNLEKRLSLVYNLILNKARNNEYDSEINKKINDNINKAQKDYYIREKIKLLREELGETTSKSKEIENILNILQTKKFPKNISEKIKEEIDKYETLPPMSGELGVIKNYIDWLVKLPWTELGVDNISLRNIEKILSKNHYGLEKVKERIVEYLAVNIRAKTQCQSTILCLVGPPGVGKTSLAKSIAEAINKKFVKISLGGVKDESEIRGHRRTYIGAMPGRIIQSMKRAGVVNPLFLLDEIDKLSSDYKGDPASALLEVLDPEQNSFFSDHYLEEPYDLSKVLFVTTANSVQAIPDALRDRLEIIELNSYTEIDKLKIAKNYLLRNIYLSHNILKKNLIIPDNVILKIIRNYTMEAGVRQLNRELSKIARKVVVKLLIQKEKYKPITITSKNLVSFLDIEKYDYNKKILKSYIGMVIGLAWTNYGGDILPIEVTLFEGKGEFKITGNLGDVMKESAAISLSYIKSNTKKFNINQQLDKIDIHIHAPEGAIPKDGPSAGITMTTAIISILKKFPVSSSLAMTGEITLRGEILPIGGLKEKLISAVRSKIKTVFIPKDNIKNISNIPKEITRSLKIIPVSNYSQIYNYIFKSIDLINLDISLLTDYYNSTLQIIKDKN